MKLEGTKWKEFRVKSIFSIEKCKCSNASSLKQGNFPYIGATNRNNGVMSLVERKESWISKGNCIVFICDGQGSVGYSIYKFEDFIGSTTLKIGRNSYLNKYNAQFLISALDKNRVIYSYGYKRSEKRLLNETILLPYDINGNPDFAFMEEYIKEEEKRKKKKHIDYVMKMLRRVEYSEIVSLNDKKWKEYNISDLFVSVQRGKRLKKADHVEGGIAYISSTSMQNGVDSFIGNVTNVRIFDNCLTIANSGSVGSTFYQPYKFIASDHVTSLKNEKMNKYVYLFLSVILERCKEKYNFNREINDHRISREKILLPINEFEEPDYVYMEQYSKNMMYKKYKQYLAYINK